MKYALIAELAIRHAYYTDGRCSDFTIEATAETAQLLANHRCVLGTTPDGIRVQTQLDDTGKAFLPMPVDAILRFGLRLRGRDFSLYTDLSAFGSTPPLFSNAGLAAGDSELKLRTAAPGQAAAGYFATVELVLGASGPGQPASYRLSFAARQARWAYYCVTDAAASAGELRIVDASPAGTTDVLVFSDANRTSLDVNPDPADPIAAQLLVKYPTLRCVRMISDQIVACREQPRKYLELRLGDERLAGPLPNPSLRDAAMENLLFRIVKFRTQPFQNP